MHILIAPNAFKNSLDSEAAAEAISNGLYKSKLNCTTACFPVADGGDGTAGLLAGHLNAHWVYITVKDPLNRKIKSRFAWNENNSTAVIELAAASGLRLLKPNEYNPLITSTFGTGELIIEALNRKASKIILCIGGSATVDAGSGILQALGVKFLDKNGKELSKLPASLPLLADVNAMETAETMKDTEIVILCDVENPLLGENGAAAVFGPQKGALQKDIEILEGGLTKLCEIVLKKTGKDMAVIKHGGAAGGVAAALNIFLGARLVNGIDYFLEITGFEKELGKADLVITGEGSIDLQTLQGKGPYGVAKKAKQFSLPVIGMAGRVLAATDKNLQQYFDQLISINDEMIDIEKAIRDTYLNLEKTAFLLGNNIALKQE